jgi:hypothetical protein
MARSEGDASRWISPLKRLIVSVRLAKAKVEPPSFIAALSKAERFFEGLSAVTNEAKSALLIAP